MKLGKKEWARWAEWIERLKSDLPATVNDRAVFHWTAKGSTAGPHSTISTGLWIPSTRLPCKYICLLTGKGYSTLKATVQFDWKKVFRVPLQKPPA